METKNDETTTQCAPRGLASAGEGGGGSFCVARVAPGAGVLRAVPDPCRPFQARWILGNCSATFLRKLREAHPEIVALQEGQTIRYRRTEICKVAGKSVASGQ